MDLPFLNLAIGSIVLTRTSFLRRYYLISIIVALNLCTIAGFGVINCVLGGSTLAAVSDGDIDSTAGIVIIALVGMVVSFGGYRFLHQYERYSWIFALLAIIITTGVGGKHLFNQVERPPPSAALVISFGGVVAGFLIPWAVSRSLSNPYLCFNADTLPRAWLLISPYTAPPMSRHGASLRIPTPVSSSRLSL